MELKVATYNIHMWVDDKYVSNLDRVAEVVNPQDPDILCLQEVYSWDDKKQWSEVEPWNETEFLRKTRFSHCLRWQGVAILSKTKISIKEYGEGQEEDLEKEGGAYHKLLEQAPVEERRSLDENRPRYVTAEASHVGQESVPVFWLSCVHLMHRYAKLRLEDLNRIASDLTPLLKLQKPQIWAGDFNALTKSDYSEDEWNKILDLRQKNGREAPSSDVTDFMETLGFRDSWIEDNKPPPRATSRFDTRIDYVYTSESFNKSWELKSILHFLHDASDHSCVIATFSLK